PARASLAQARWPQRGPVLFDAEHFNRLPAEVALRLLGRAIARAGDEGPIQLGKLETLYEGLTSADRGKTSRWRRTLAGALITREGSKLAIEGAPPRRHGTGRAVYIKQRDHLEWAKRPPMLLHTGGSMVKGIELVPLAGGPPALRL